MEPWQQERRNAQKRGSANRRKLEKVGKEQPVQRRFQGEKQAAGDPETSPPLPQGPAVRRDHGSITHRIADNYRLVVVRDTEHAVSNPGLCFHIYRVQLP